MTINPGALYVAIKSEEQEREKKRKAKVLKTNRFGEILQLSKNSFDVRICYWEWRRLLRGTYELYHFRKKANAIKFFEKETKNAKEDYQWRKKPLLKRLFGE